jgi:hypothetical protein
MSIRLHPLRHVMGDRLGVALPSALFCLLALTLLVTGMLITASTDAVTSLAQQTAAEDLHAAEGAIEAWISEREQNLEPVELAEWTAPGGPQQVRLRVERLARWTTQAEPPERITVFAIHAEAIRGLGGGRAVVALVRIREEQLPASEGDGELGATGAEGGGEPVHGELEGPVALNQAAWGPPRVENRTFGWFEVVR